MSSKVPGPAPEKKRPPHRPVMLRLPPEVKMKLKRLAAQRGQRGEPDSMLATVIALIRRAPDPKRAKKVATNGNAGTE